MIGGPDLAADPVLSTVAAYREAARRIAHRPGPMAGEHGKPRAIVDLVRMIDREPDRLTRDWAREAVYVEVRDLLGCEPTTDDVTPPLRAADRIRHLLRAGYRRCPVCLGKLTPLATAEAST